MSAQYNFDTIIDRSNSNCEKWSRYPSDVLPMWVADMDFKAPPSVIEALSTRIDHGALGYGQSSIELIDLLKARLFDRFGWEVKAEEIVFIPGVMRGVHMASQAIGSEGSEIAFHTPVYFPFFQVPLNTQRKLIQQEMVLNSQAYEIDFDRFEKALSEKTNLYVLCNPQNPTGRVFSKNELEQIASICLENDMIICSDEIHNDLVYNEHKHIPIASLSPEVARKTVTLFSPSKAFNIPGLYCSVMIIQDSELRKKVLAAGKGFVGNVNILGYTAAIAAYGEGNEWLKDLLQYLESNRNYLSEYIKEQFPEISYNLPEATCLAWLDCRGLSLNENPFEHFLKKAKVALNDGEAFGPGGKGFVRLNFGCPRSMLIEGLERMKDSMKYK